MKKIIKTDQEMKQFGAELAQQLSANFCLELIGDIGTGKTTLTKGLINNLNSEIEATSPSFVINNRYQISDERLISHFDFYRLGAVGIDDQQLAEDLADQNTGVIIEWADSISDLLPANRVKITINYDQDDGRILEIEGLA